MLASGWVTSGPEVGAFESELAATVGAAHAVGVSSCTAGIELSLRSLHLPEGSAVLTSTLTFCGAVQAILHAGLRPVLVDVDEVTGVPTTETVAARSCHGASRRRWSSCTGPATPLTPCCWRRPQGCHSTASSRTPHTPWARSGDGVPVGSGSAVCFSFYATKNLPIGEGGMVTTDDEDRAAWMRRARLHGMSADAWRRYLPGGGWRYDVEEAGLKANLTDLQAAIGRAQLRAFPGWQQRRQAIATRYDAALADVDGLGLPHRPADEDGVHAWHLYPVRVADGLRDRVQAELADRDISTSVHFIPVHHLQWFRQECWLPRGGLRGADSSSTSSCPCRCTRA